MRGDAPPPLPFDGLAAATCAATFAAAKGVRVGSTGGGFAAVAAARLLPPAPTACAPSAKECGAAAWLFPRRERRAAAAAAAAVAAVAAEASAATANAERARGRNSSDREENSCVTIACWT
jgi:hypothetical protein